MPKVTVEFNLPDEQEEYDMYMRAGEFHSILWGLDQHMRSGIKHGHQYKTVEDALESLRRMLYEGLQKSL